MKDSLGWLVLATSLKLAMSLKPPDLLLVRQRWLHS
jgi:hypothetical protein